MLGASRPVRGAWIEISRRIGKSRKKTQSRPVRGAWIEMDMIWFMFMPAPPVAPRKGRVD